MLRGRHSIHQTIASPTIREMDEKVTCCMWNVRTIHSFPAAPGRDRLSCFHLEQQRAGQNKQAGPSSHRKPLISVRAQFVPAILISFIIWPSIPVLSRHICFFFSPPHSTRVIHTNTSILSFPTFPLHLHQFSLFLRVTPPSSHPQPPHTHTHFPGPRPHLLVQCRDYQSTMENFWLKVNKRY